jgi:DNA segregation ATPase FtsK/SpoIIIE-like protein
VADTEQSALEVLADLVDEMNRRRALYSRFPGCDSLKAYNALTDTPLPAIALLIDESTALLSDRPVENAIRTLALRARKFGVYAILGGQDWKAASLDTAIRNQLSTRVQFKAQDGSQSRVLLGAPDAANLDRPGRAYALLPGRPRLELQAPFISVPTIQRHLLGLGQSVRPAPPGQPDRVDSPLAGSDEEVTGRAARIIELWDSGVRVKKDLCEQAYGPGKTSGKYYQLVEKVLAEYGRI